MSDGLVIEEATAVTPEVLAAFARLVPQLSRSAPAVGEQELAAMIAAPGTTVLLARLGGEVVGTLTLIVFRIPTGVRAWIEDVVVDGAARGHGAATALTRAAIAKAGAEGVRTVDLTSRPARDAANRLYLGMGFERRDTNVYRYALADGEDELGSA